MRKSDPGFPLRAYAQNNSIALELYLDKIVDVVLYRIIQLGLLPNNNIPNDAAELVRLGLVDLIRLFPKNEPHKKSKLDENRIRLISSVSLVDNIVDRCIFGLQNANEIENWKTIPSKPGMGFTTDSVNTLIDSVSKFKDPKSTDAKAWDWSVQGWEFDMEAEARIELMKDVTPFIANLIRNRMFCMSLGLFALPDGALYAQTIRGIMKSGLYITSSSNSRIGFMVYVMIGGKPHSVMVQGDDTVQEHVKGFTDEYYKFGHTVVETDVSSGFEFCSQHFKDGSRYSLNAPKLVFNLLHKLDNTTEDRIARFDIFYSDLGNHPDKEYYISLLDKAGYFRDFDPEVVTLSH